MVNDTNKVFDLSCNTDFKCTHTHTILPTQTQTAKLIWYHSNFYQHNLLFMTLCSVTAYYELGCDSRVCWNIVAFLFFLVFRCLGNILIVYLIVYWLIDAMEPTRSMYIATRLYRSIYIVAVIFCFMLSGIYHADERPETQLSDVVRPKKERNEVWIHFILFVWCVLSIVSILIG